MTLTKRDFISCLLLFIISILTVFDLFANVGRSANMDGLVHITTIAQFTAAFKDGDFPVTWLDGFANYGMPIGIIAHQLPTYLGMFINLVVSDPVLSFNIVCFFGILLSNIFFYFFLRVYFDSLIAFVAVFLFNFAPYRIIDLYIRGAIPETFSMIFLPIILLSIYYIVQRKNIFAFFTLIASLAALILTHPMMLITYSFIFIPYLFFAIYRREKKHTIASLFSKISIKIVVAFFAALLIALGIGSYYILPLNGEIKYFFYGHEKNHLVANQFMGIANYIDPNWYYFLKTDIFPRGHFIKSGLVESIGVILGIMVIVWGTVRKKYTDNEPIFVFAVLVSILVIFFTTKFSAPIYSLFPILGNIQFPWRLFSAFIFLPPIIYASFFKKIGKEYLLIAFVLLICILRFPQLYGKNYTAYPLKEYLFTPLNLHSNNMNTIWTGQTEEYPIAKQKPAIISGKGTITIVSQKNSQREYTIHADTPVKLVDNTFYFPGWNVLIDGIKTTIQFQDPNHRGVITYDVPQGEHTIIARFEDTKIRLAGRILSICFIAFVLGLFVLRKKLAKVLL